jgi:glucose-6-phosphate isomerase
MFPEINPLHTIAWTKLKEHLPECSNTSIRELFASDKARFERYSIRQEDLLFDYSKNRITDKTMQLLLDLAEECGLKAAVDAMFSGELINKTENRAVLHTALRNRSKNGISVDGKDVMPLIHEELSKIERFCDEVHSGRLTGYSGKKIKYLVNIGIGGSDLGPHMVTEALMPYQDKGIEPHFVSNVDPSHLSGVLKKVDPETTLFVVASKTFTTQETMANAIAAKKWLLDRSNQNSEAIFRQFAAISTNGAEMTAFGISPTNRFTFWDWVGGRYSLWSSIGLSIALTVGFERYEELLQGAHSADLHFRNTAFQENIPVIMALIGIWYRNFHGCQTEAILPYDQHLHRFPAYFQQGNMESNGKSVDRKGNALEYDSAPVIWGEPGTNGQHSFYQLLHQGTVLVPCDFIASAQSHYPISNQHEKLLSNFFAQTEALMMGFRHEDPFRNFEGNRPSNSFLLKKLTPFTLGKLIAYYEHKIFVQGVIWNIFSFDQWGVELGKKLASIILTELGNNDLISTHDGSTNGLINEYKKLRQ